MTASRRTLFACPVDVTLSLITGKWKPMILWLLAARPLRFGELQAAMPHIAHKVLSAHLRQLENHGVIERAGRGAKSAGYQLTELGLTLRPALDALANWGKVHHRAIGAEYGAGDDDPAD